MSSKADISCRSIPHVLEFRVLKLRFLILVVGALRAALLTAGSTVDEQLMKSRESLLDTSLESRTRGASRDLGSYLRNASYVGSPALGREAQPSSGGAISLVFLPGNFIFSAILTRSLATPAGRDYSGQVTRKVNLSSR